VLVQAKTRRFIAIKHMHERKKTMHEYAVQGAWLLLYLWVESERHARTNTLHARTNTRTNTLFIQQEREREPARCRDSESNIVWEREGERERTGDRQRARVCVREREWERERDARRQDIHISIQSCTAPFLATPKHTHHGDARIMCQGQRQVNAMAEPSVTLTNLPPYKNKILQPRTHDTH